MWASLQLFFLLLRLFGPRNCGSQRSTGATTSVTLITDRERSRLPMLSIVENGFGFAVSCIRFSLRSSALLSNCLLCPKVIFGCILVGTREKMMSDENKLAFNSLMHEDNTHPPSFTFPFLAPISTFPSTTTLVLLSLRHLLFLLPSDKQSSPSFSIKEQQCDAASAATTALQLWWYNEQGGRCRTNKENGYWSDSFFFSSLPSPSSSFFSSIFPFRLPLQFSLS